MFRVQAQNEFVPLGFMADWRHFFYQTLTQKDPCDPSNVICKPYLLPLICIPVQAKLNKKPREKGAWGSSLRDYPAFSPQADHILVVLVSSMTGGTPQNRIPHNESVSVLFVHLFCFLDLTYKRNNTVFDFSVLLISFRVIPSRSSHVVINGKVSFFMHK